LSTFILMSRDNTTNASSTLTLVLALVSKNFTLYSEASFKPTHKNTQRQRKSSAKKLPTFSLRLNGPRFRGWSGITTASFVPARCPSYCPKHNTISQQGIYTITICIIRLQTNIPIIHIHCLCLYNQPTFHSYTMSCQPPNCCGNTFYRPHALLDISPTASKHRRIMLLKHSAKYF